MSAIDKPNSSTHKRRRASTIILVVVTIPVLLGMAALTIDTGMLFSTRADLQHASDAAAMAAASAYLSDDMMSVRMSDGDYSFLTSVRHAAIAETKRVTMGTALIGTAETYVEREDIVLGWIDTTSGTSPIDPGAAPATFNAAQVTIRRDARSTNGPVPLMFARVFGKYHSEVTATAVAIFDDRIAGYESDSGGPPMLPLTMNITDYANQMAAATDDFSYDEDSGNVSRGSDGLFEINLYPNSEAPGNYGLLNIGTTSSMGTSALGAQIQRGVSPDEIDRETGSSELTFYTETGTPHSYQIDGNTGMKSSLEGDIETYEGQIVAFFVHDAVSGSGSNAVYNIRGMRWGRLMHAGLQNSAASKGVYIQPISYTGPGVINDVNAPSSGGVAGQIVLAR